MGQATLLSSAASSLVSSLVVVVLMVPLARRSRGRPHAWRWPALLLSAALYGLALLSLIALRLVLVRPHTSYGGEHFNHGHNAVWLGVEWVNQPHAPQEIQQLAADLTRQQIEDVFVYVSYLKARPGASPAFIPSYHEAPAFIRELRKSAPQLRIQAWIGLPLTTFELADPAQRATIRSFCAYLIAQAGADGIHLDPEPILDGDAQMLGLLEELRRDLPHALLSIATPAMYPLLPNLPWHPWIPNTAWSSAYYQAVAQRVDQIVVMSYDSGYDSPQLYQLWMQFQVVNITSALHGMPIDLRFGIPTSEEETDRHHLRAEGMESGLAGLLDGLNDAQADPGLVRGISIYPYWETDAREWQLYGRRWLGAP